MKRIGLFVALMAVVAAGCSKDKGDSPGEKTPSPGVSVVPASELGPRADEIVDEVSITTSSKEARAAFVRGRELFENIRHGEAAEKFREAIELDDKFALAHTYLGMATYGAEGMDLLKKGFQLAETLPPAERMVTKVFLIKRQGDKEKHTAAVAKMAELAPGDWRVQMWFAQDQQDIGNIDAALAAFEKSTRLNDKAAEPYNYIAYIHANAGRYDKAVEAAKTYADLKPSEPNPLDSLGEILMMAGKFEEAEAAFTRAVNMAPKFAIAWEGVAMTRLYREDYDGAIEAFEKAKAGAFNANGRNKAVNQIAWVKLTRGDLDGALAVIDSQLEPEKGYENQVNIARAELYAGEKNYEAAMKELKPAIAHAKKKGPDGAEMLGWALVKKASLQANAGHTAKAEQTLAEIEKLQGDIKSGFFRFGLAYARGTVALAKGDHEAAFAQFDEITNPLFPYGVEAMWAKADCLAGAGKADEAEALRTKLRGTFRREVYHAYRMNRAR